MESWTYLHDHVLTGQGLEAKVSYPTQRYYRNDREGKPGTRSDAVFGAES